MVDRKVSSNFIHFSSRLNSELGYEKKKRGRFSVGHAGKEVSKNHIKQAFIPNDEFSHLEKWARKWIKKCEKVDFSSLNDEAVDALEATQKFLIEDVGKVKKNIEEVFRIAGDISQIDEKELDSLEDTYFRVLSVWNGIHEVSTPTASSQSSEEASSPKESPTKRTNFFDPNLPGIRSFIRMHKKRVGLNVPTDSDIEHLKALHKKYVLKKKKTPFPGEEGIADTLQYYGKELDRKVLQIQKRMNESKKVDEKDLLDLQNETRMFETIMKGVKKDLVPREETAPEARYIPQLYHRAVVLRQIAETFKPATSSRDPLLSHVKFTLETEGIEQLSKKETKQLSLDFREDFLDTPPTDKTIQIEVAKTLIDSMRKDPNMFFWTEDPLFEQILDRAIWMFPGENVRGKESSAIENRIVRIENKVMNAKHLWTTNNLVSSERLFLDYQRVYNETKDLLILHEKRKIKLTNQQLMRMGRAISAMDFYKRQTEGVRRVYGIEGKRPSPKVIRQAGALVPTQKLGDKLRGKTLNSQQRMARQSEQEQGINRIFELISKNLSTKNP